MQFSDIHMFMQHNYVNTEERGDGAETFPLTICRIKLFLQVGFQYIPMYSAVTFPPRIKVI